MRIVRTLLEIITQLRNDTDLINKTTGRNHLHWKDFLVQPDDLPPFQKAGENVIYVAGNPILRSSPGAIFHATQWIDNHEISGEIGGDVQLTLFLTDEQAKQFYMNTFLHQLNAEPIASIGEQAIVQYPSTEVPITTLYFLRCKAIIRVWGLWQIENSKPRGRFRTDDVIQYATKLDKRIRESVCSPFPICGIPSIVSLNTL